MNLKGLNIYPKDAELTQKRLCRKRDWLILCLFCHQQEYVSQMKTLLYSDFFPSFAVKCYILNLLHVLGNIVHITTRYFIDYFPFTVVALFEDSNLNHNNFTKLFLEPHEFHMIVI